MRYTIIAIILSLAPFFTFAQPPGVKSGPGPNQYQAPKIGIVEGKVTDGKTGEVLEFATVGIYRAKDSVLVTGGTTNEKGKFRITELPSGKFFMRTDFIGYEQVQSDLFEITKENSYFKFDEIVLGVSATILETVEITEQKPLIVNQLDKKVYDVQKDITNEGSDGLRMLENIPSVEVDVDGNISLRGNENVKILIDGRPSAFSVSDLLQQMPASAIAQVEIITNPSAKYDPEGTSGILNIITKKEKAMGFNGNANANFGYGKTPKYGAGLGLNLRNQNFNIYGNFGFNNRQNEITGTSDRIVSNPDTSYTTLQNETGKRNSKSYNIRTGIDWFANDQNVFYTGFTFRQGTGDRGRDVMYTYLDENDEFEGSADRLTDNEGDNTGYSVNAGWQRTFGTSDHNLEVDFNYSDNESKTINDYFEQNYDENGIEIDLPTMQKQNSDNRNNVFVARADYVRPFQNGSILELGARFDRDEVDEDYTGEYFDYEKDEYVVDDRVTNHFVYNQDVGAAYATFGDDLGKFSYKAGLRAEQTYMTSRLLTTDETFTNDYFSFFPSAFLGYQVSESSEFSLSYSRRISRPRTRQLNPFTSYSDPQNVRTGNPFLKPEFAQVFEAGHQKLWKKGSVNTTVYYQKINDQISRYLEYTDAGNSILTYENIGTADRIGLELITSYRPAKWAMLSLTGNFNYQKLKTINVETPINQESSGYSLRFMSRNTLPKGYSIQLDANYRGARNTNQGRIFPRYGINLGFRKSLWNKNGTLSINIRDVFNTYQFKFETSDNQPVQQVRSFKWESQTITVSLSYNFGKRIKAPERKQKRDSNEFRGGDDDMGM